MEDKVQSRYKELISLVTQAGIDLDKISLRILSDFKLKTESKAKQFDKVARKDKKNILKFVDKEIKPFWINYVEKEDEQILDLRRHLEKEDFLNYLSGIYILIHSKRTQDIDFIVKSTLAEMYQKVATNLKMRGLV